MLTDPQQRRWQGDVHRISSTHMSSLSVPFYEYFTDVAPVW